MAELIGYTFLRLVEISNGRAIIPIILTAIFIVLYSLEEETIKNLECIY